MKKTLNRIFLILSAAVLAAGLLHTAIAYGMEIVRQRREPFATSFPPEVMLFLFLPYAAALIVLFAVWFCLRERQRGLGRLNVAIRTCGLLAILIACACILTVVLVAATGKIDFLSVCGVAAPFLVLLAPILLTMLICFLVKRKRPAANEPAAKGENEEEV